MKLHTSQRSLSRQENEIKIEFPVAEIQGDRGGYRGGDAGAPPPGESEGGAGGGGTIGLNNCQKTRLNYIKITLKVVFL